MIPQQLFQSCMNIVIISVGMYLDVGNGHQVYIMVQDKLTVWQILQRFQLHSMVKLISFNSASAPSNCFVNSRISACLACIAYYYAVWLL